jgi:hypothetical protein
MSKLEHHKTKEDDQGFALTLNQVRVRKHTDKDVSMLMTKLISTDDSEHLSDGLNKIAHD